MSDLRPVLVMRTAEMVHLLPLGKPKDNGAFAIPVDKPYEYVGDITAGKIKGNDGTEVKRWFGHVQRTDVTVGPYPNGVKAVEGLLAYLGYYQVKGTDTMDPLF